MQISKKLIYLLVFVVAFCSIVYELVFAQALSVVFGNTIVQYSLVIGSYMSALGIGSIYLSKRISKIKNKINYLVFVEVFISFVALFGIVFIFFMSQYAGFHNVYFNIFVQILSYIPVVIVGFLSGIELPLLVYLYKKDSFAEVLGVDYFGSLFGTIVFAFVFYPILGIFITISVVSFMNILVAFAVSLYSKFEKQNILYIFLPIFIMFIILFSFHDRFFFNMEKWFMGNIVSNIYSAYIFKPEFVNIYNIKHTKYQTISEYEIYFSKFDSDKCFNIDMHIQGCGNWVDSYHLGAVHIPMSFLKKKNAKLDILILGGGDFIAVDYLRKDFDNIISSIDLVDIDKEFQEYAKRSNLIRTWNNEAHLYNKLNIYVDDAFSFLRKNKDKKYDLIIIDLPGLKSAKLLPMYSVEFYKFAKNAMKDNSFIVSWIYPPSMDRFSDFNDILLTTLKMSGFNKRLIYNAVQPEYENIFETETFMLLTNADIKTKIQPNTWYIKKFRNYFKKFDWDNIEKTNKRENSIFKPNLAMLIKDYDR